MLVDFIGRIKKNLNFCLKSATGSQLLKMATAKLSILAKTEKNKKTLIKDGGQTGPFGRDLTTLN